MLPHLRLLQSNPGSADSLIYIRENVVRRTIPEAKKLCLNKGFV
jgi:hypothetical protein